MASPCPLPGLAFEAIAGFRDRWALLPHVFPSSERILILSYDCKLRCSFN